MRDSVLLYITVCPYTRRSALIGPYQVYTAVHHRKQQCALIYDIGPLYTAVALYCCFIRQWILCYLCWTAAVGTILPFYTAVGTVPPLLYCCWHYTAVLYSSGYCGSPPVLLWEVIVTLVILWNGHNLYFITQFFNAGGVIMQRVWCYVGDIIFPF